MASPSAASTTSSAEPVPAGLIPAIVLTGGPCGGKSTAMAALLQKLPGYGVTPLVVSEVATDIFSSGLSIADVVTSPERYEAFQRAMIRAQIAKEDAWRHFAAAMPGERHVLLCDRGALDPRAYMDASSFERVVRTLFGMSAHDFAAFCEERYHGVLHLTSAADGAEHAYTLANNAARTETAAEARGLDQRTLAAWTGHRRLRVIGNSERVGASVSPVPFDRKMSAVLTETCRLLGLPVPAPRERKFQLAAEPHHGVLPEGAVRTLIDQTYLRSASSSIERRIRKITPTQIVTAGDSTPNSTYIYTEKEPHPTGEGRVTRERVISAREYRTLLEERDASCQSIHKIRTAFTWHQQYFQLDCFRKTRNLVLLEVTPTDVQPEVQLPPFVDVVADVSDRGTFTNRALAQVTYV